ncbi:MAG: PAS domain-containing protein [Bacteroidetes bacterium]|nr:PAS domain-containing protein [Bacteroidota bacterium]
MVNALLKSQIQKHFGVDSLPENLSGFLKVVSSTYNQYENDRVHLERSIEINSEEMISLYQSQKKAHDELKDLFEKMVDGLYKSSHEGKFIDANPALVKMLGYDNKEELFAIDIKTDLYFDPTDRDEAVYQDKVEGISVFRLRKKDGSEIWVEDRGQYVTDKEGNVLYHEGILRDVTERVKSELQLKRSQRETADYRKALDQSLVVSITDQKGKLTYANENFCTLSNYSIEELLGNDTSLLNYSCHTPEFMENLNATINKGDV